MFRTKVSIFFIIIFCYYFTKLKRKKRNFTMKKLKKLIVYILFLSTIILPFSNNAHSTHSTSTIAPHGSFFVDDDDI